MRWGIGIALLSIAAVGLGVAPGEAGAQAPWPIYHPVYEPAPEYTPEDGEKEEPPKGPRIAAAIPAPAPLPDVFGIRRVKRVWGNGRAIVFIRVFAPGRVFVWGRGVRTLARTTNRPRVVRVPVKPKSRLLRRLRDRGRAKIEIKLAFRPRGGVALPPRDRPILLRKKRR